MVTKQQLIDLGFSSKEAGVYLSLLQLGPATATEIARHAKINRTTAYDILGSLASEGLINLLGETKVQRFAAEGPHKVLDFLKNRIEKTKSQLIQAQTLMPEMLSIYNTKAKPKVRYYEGTEGVQAAFEDTLTATETIRVYAVGEDMFKALSEEYFRDYFKRRVKAGIAARVIAPDTPETRAVIANDKTEMRTSILVPKEKFYFSTETNIYDNKVMIASWREKFAVIIESEEIAAGYKKTFELAWEGAKNLRVWSSLNLSPAPPALPPT